MNAPTANKRFKKLLKKINSAYNELNEDIQISEDKKVIHNDIGIRKIRKRKYD